MSTKVNMDILATLTKAKEANETLIKVSKAPRDKRNDLMLSAIVLGADLTEKQFESCRPYLKGGNIAKGTINTIARYMAPNDGNIRLRKLLKDCKSESQEDRIEYLKSIDIGSYSQLKRACIVTSEEATNKKLAKELSDMPSTRVDIIVAMATDIRNEKMSNDQNEDMKTKQSALTKILMDGKKATKTA